VKDVNMNNEHDYELEILDRLLAQVQGAITLVKAGLVVHDPGASRFIRWPGASFSVGDFEIKDMTGGQWFQSDNRVAR